MDFHDVISMIFMSNLDLPYILHCLNTNSKKKNIFKKNHTEKIKNIYSHKNYKHHKAHKTKTIINPKNICKLFSQTVIFGSQHAE